MWIIAHRGASGSAPENTIAAFRRAVELGAEFIEADLQLTRDARLVAIHDETVDRTTDGRGPVSGKTIEQVRQLDAGAWYPAPGPKPGPFAGERVPSVEDVLALGKESDLGLYLDLKPMGPSGAEHAMVSALQTAGEISRSVVLSFDPSCLRLLQGFSLCWLPASLFDEDLPDAVSRAVAAGYQGQLCLLASASSQALLEEAHRRDLKLVALGRA